MAGVSPVEYPSTIDKESLNQWDPFCQSKWDNEQMSVLGVGRIKRDITTIISEPPPLIFMIPEEENISKIHAIISGAENTPYEGGFFYFFLRMPPDYPIVPPKVKFMTTGNGMVRFNPNLYANGKVCLSILGTWSGPKWSAAQSLSSLLISIQSLLNEKPYHNEPGFEKERHIGDSKKYNDCIRHETLRVAVCEMLEGRIQMPPQVRELIEQSFLQYTGHYDEVVRENMHLDGQILYDPFNKNKGRFQYSVLMQRLMILKENLTKKYSGRWFAK